jgi:hypothetical protein
VEQGLSFSFFRRDVGPEVSLKMSDYIVGYKKPPKSSQFKKGVSPNPSGRPKGKKMTEYGMLGSLLNAPISYTENGKKKVASRPEITIRGFAAEALKGDVGKALLLLKLWENASSISDAETFVLYLSEDDMRA